MRGRDSILGYVTGPVSLRSTAPRTLVVVAHPDDEALALGARLSRHTDSFFVHVTDGAPLDGADAARYGFASVDQYRAARAEELRHAFRVAHISESRSKCLNIPDQRASFHLEELAERVRILIREFEPLAILTHAYEGGHPDHDACAFAAHRAVAMIDPQRRPELIEAALYHAGPDGRLETGCFLSWPVAYPEIIWRLNPAEKLVRQHLLDSFVTQRETLRHFDAGVERFRIAPPYDFTQPIQQRPLLYEQYPWGMTGERFRCLAAEAMACR